MLLGYRELRRGGMGPVEPLGADMNSVGQIISFYAVIRQDVIMKL